MTDGNTGNKAAAQINWKLWLGVALTATSVITAVVVYFISAQLFSAGKTQIGLVLGFIVGSTLTTIGLHSSGRIAKETLERVTLALAVAAIVFAIWQFRDSRMQESRMESLSKEIESRMESLSKEMSTHFIGIFPKNMKDINEVVARADSSLDIMTDFVGYGHYSAPDEFDKYRRKLQDLRSQKRLPIRLLVYARDKGGKLHDTQFTDDAFQKALRRHDWPLVNFCQRFNGGKLPTSKKELDALLFRKQKDYMKDLKDRGVRIRVTETEMPFFLWDEDDQEAVFSFLNEDQPGAREESFRTIDGSVVSTFKVRFCKLWNEADEVEVTDAGWEAKPSDKKEKCIAQR